MVPPHRRASGGLEPAGRALEPAGRASEPAGRPLEPAGRALKPAGLREGRTDRKNSRKSVTWSAVPYTSLLVSLMLAI